MEADAETRTIAITTTATATATATATTATTQTATAATAAAQSATQVAGGNHTQRCTKILQSQLYRLRNRCVVGVVGVFVYGYTYTYIMHIVHTIASFI